MKSTLAVLVLLFAVSHARKIVVEPTSPPKSEPASDVDCPNSLCKWLRVGSIFRLSEDKPNYFVTCTYGGSVCRKCQGELVFDNRNKACVRDFRGSSTTTTTTTTTTPEPTTTTTTPEPTTTTTTPEPTTTTTTPETTTTTTTPEPTTTTTTPEPTTTTTTPEPTTTTEGVDAPEVYCPNSLCKWRRNGALFRYSNQQPEYFVHCSNHIASCKKCAKPGTQFNNKFWTCFRRTFALKRW